MTSGPGRSLWRRPGVVARTGRRHAPENQCPAGCRPPKALRSWKWPPHGPSHQPLQARAGRGAPQIGLWCTLSSSVAVEVGGGLGLRLAADRHRALPQRARHGAVAAPGGLRLPEPRGGAPRLERHGARSSACSTSGAQSLLIPYVQDAEEARQAVSYTRYPPEGKRGVSGVTPRHALRAGPRLRPAGARGAVRARAGGDPPGAGPHRGDRRGRRGRRDLRGPGQSGGRPGARR